VVCVCARVDGGGLGGGEREFVCVCVRVRVCAHACLVHTPGHMLSWGPCVCIHDNVCVCAYIIVCEHTSYLHTRMHTYVCTHTHKHTLLLFLCMPTNWEISKKKISS
jgi:hypothetical protein